MPVRKTKKPTKTNTDTPGSAPELSPAMAKQYGLHNAAVTVKADKAAEREKLASSPEVATTEAVTPELPILTDPKTDQAVDAIVASEGDELLAAQDALSHEVSSVTPAPQGFWRRIGHFFKAWATSPRARWITLIVVFLVVVAIALIPHTRYFALNTAGVRSSASVTVTDNSTRLPLKNVAVHIGDQKAQTDIKGKATLTGLKLGPQTLRIERLAFTSSKKQITIGWGSNPQGNFSLDATGLQYTITVRDFIADKPLESAEATADGLNALSDKKGVITFTVSDRDPKDMTVTIGKKGYRSEKVVLKPTEPQTGSARLVPSAKDFYVSKQNGKYDLYAIDADGQNKKAILNGTGNETQNISLAVAPAGDWAAMIATRDPIRSKDGYLLQAITLVNEDGTTATTLERAEQIQLIDWVGTKIIYQITVASASAANNQRSRLIAYDYTTSSRIQLATANRFNAVHIIKGVVYYAVASADPTTQPSLIKVRPDGTGRQTIWDKEVWTAWRIGYMTLALQTADGWFSYSGSGTPAKTIQVPAEGRQYTTSSDESKTVWVDTRDGKGAIIATDTVTGKETILVTADGITYPLRWLNGTTIVYRVVTDSETADYVFSTQGGQPRKVTDVTNAHGFTRF